MRKAITRLGAVTYRFFNEAGEIFSLLGKILFFSKKLIEDRALLFEQMIAIGYNSLPIVLMVGAFTGAVSAWQTNYQIEGYVPVRFLGLATYKAVVIELGPVLTALILAGRIGSSIAAELGTMKVTEQIDALESLAINSVRYLAVPRFFAGLFMMPILVIFADFIAVLGAFLVAQLFLGIPPQIFFSEIPTYFHVHDIMAGLYKATMFGAIISLIGCYIGFATTGGAEGVGKATIRSFVLSAILILIADYLMATLLF
ncbi:ABC transporter permease [candidate division LCP-89 bacterium B3_LCP]|uniref:ABC transporter permease n=1 Tax=candidate division LCP-89 bacterium B3_LCP TaxID=2012998 RepID=A0A532UQQ3_UNCL8|nr:MAG: ABC transporter permease [candidate division LCP-89 bacterium B3_LCP]